MDIASDNGQLVREKRLQRLQHERALGWLRLLERLYETRSAIRFLY